MYLATAPSLVTRLAFLPATEMPFLRSRTTACSRSPLASVRACLQSIIGAPVFSRSSFTWVAEIFKVDVLIKNVLGRSSFVVGNPLYRANGERPKANDCASQILTRAGQPARV